MDKNHPNIDEAHLLESAATMRGHSNVNIIDFTAYDPSLDGAWLTNWQNTIDAAEIFIDDETYLDKVQGLTVIVDEAVTVCLNFQRDLKYYSEKVWGTKNSHYRAFRFPKMHEISKSVPRFITYCRVNHELATKYTGDLNTVNMPATLLADFLNAITDLMNKDSHHQFFMQDRLNVTAARIVMFNSVYDFMRNANSAAANIYRENPEKFKLFDLPTPKQKAKEEV